ncbi:MAG: SPFH/Band 7/PHB domain protein [Burkholderiaceae bacterium]|nr:MAG: SPFH/Band 7/PHB domain protein [Burkholderiaceae bacterium]
MDAFFVFTIALVFLVIVILAAGVKVVPQGYQWTVERFGRYTRTLQPGLTLIVPFIDTIGRKLSVMESVLDVPSQNVISRDNVAVTADGVVFFRIDNAAQAAYQIDNLKAAIVNLTTTNLRSVLGSMELDHMLSNREQINDRLLLAVDAATAPWGVKVTRIEIRDLNMAPELQEAMNLQMTAERHRRAVVTKANGQKEAEILQAEGEKQAAVLRAEGEKQAAILIAEARERQAQAEAKATKDVSEAISGGNIQAIQYFLGLKYVEAIKDIGSSQNSKLVLMPLEAGGVTGAVAGIAELLKASNITTPTA